MARAPSTVPAAPPTGSEIQKAAPQPQSSPGGAVPSEAFFPTAESAQTAREPKGVPVYPFTFWFHPDRYEVRLGSAGYAIVPELRRFDHAPGVNLVEEIERQDGGRMRKFASTDLAFSQLRSKGFRLVPQNAGGLQSYARKVMSPVTGSILGYIDAWTSVFPGTDLVRIDEVSRTDWLLRLMADGVIPYPAPHIVEALRSKMEASMDRYVATKHKRHAKILADRMAAFSAEIGVAAMTEVAGTFDELVAEEAADE